jgi:hypothetical protein
MTSIFQQPARTLAAAALGATLMIVGHPTAWADPAPGAPVRDGRQAGGEQRQEWMAARIKTRLDRVANRLEIKASQQSAWDSFAKAVSAMPAMSIKRPDGDADAATLARFRADRAAAFAAKLAQVADATAKLQAILTPEQRKTLNQIAQHFGHHGRRWGNGGHGFGGQGGRPGWGGRGDDEEHGHGPMWQEHHE